VTRRAATVRTALGLAACLGALDPAPVSGVSQPPPAPAATSAPLSARNASYTIDVRLDPALHTLAGRQTLEWRNISRIATSELQFHLYYNAWRDKRSTFMRERLLAGRGELASRPAEDWASIDVTAIHVTGGALQPADLTAGLRFISPDDGNGDDRTVVTVPLPSPIEPGQSVTLEIAWRSKIPRPFARTGVVGNSFFIAQWFPKIGVLEDAGWNCHQFHSSTEFFADYGVYDVRMTVPRGWVVGATGIERERRDNADNTTTHRYVQEDVHDFVWTTSPDYMERQARFDPRDPSAPAGWRSLPPVNMRLLLQPEHESQAERHFEATRAALGYYGEWFGAYPYGHITIVDPAWQSDADGMEYPTLVTAGTSWLAPFPDTEPVDVTVHEAGHQFWYGIVGSNEFEDAWMDEGLTTFSTARIHEMAFPRFRLVRRYFGGFVPYVFRDIRWSRTGSGDRLAGYRANATSDVEATPSFRYWPGSTLAITYAKPALWLHTLERWLGWPALQRILQIYFDRWKFRHPKPDDFFQIAREVSPTDLTPFLDQVYRGSSVFDYGVQRLASEPAGEGRYQTDVVVRRYGDGMFPVDVLVTFGDGQRVRERWDGRDRWKLYTYERAARAVSAQVDPDRVLQLDVNYTNNSRSLAPKTDRAATKWALKWMVWLQDLLLTWAFVV
jgi:hypothetical protein